MATTTAAEPRERAQSLGGIRLVAGYVAVFAFLAAAIAISISIGHSRHAAPGIAGFYSSSSACLGKSFTVNQSGEFVDFSGGPTGKLRLHGNDHLRGTVHCLGGTAAAIDLVASGTTLTGTIGGTAATAKFTAPLPPPGSSAKP